MTFIETLTENNEGSCECIRSFHGDSDRCTTVKFFQEIIWADTNARTLMNIHGFVQNNSSTFGALLFHNGAKCCRMFAAI